MIIIEAGLVEISIDDKKEYAIFHESYPGDEFGHPISEDSPKYESGDFYEYGHIFIETENKRYCLKTVPDIDDWMIELLNYIRTNREQENIIVDMSELKESPDGDFYIFEFDGFSVERL